MRTTSAVDRLEIVRGVWATAAHHRLRGWLTACLAVLLFALPSVVQAKGGLTDLWIVGGDLPYPVKVPSEFLHNAGTGHEAASETYRPQTGTLGVGYDLLPGATLAAALSTMDAQQGYQTFYPDGLGGGLLQNWQPVAADFATTPQDRYSRGWAEPSGGIYRLTAQFIAMAKAGLVDQQPTFAEALGALRTLYGVQVRVDGAPLAETDAVSLVPALTKVPAVLLPAQQNLDAVPGVTLIVAFGDTATEGLRYRYVPPGQLAVTGLLLPAVLRGESAPQQATLGAIATSAAQDALLAPRVPPTAPTSTAAPSSWRERWAVTATLCGIIGLLSWASVYLWQRRAVSTAR